ncbi:MAG: efflux RND transporter periplasmic adaptor subunit, partial [Opitutales bacterium]|nr:efflux RND transporter periplasmic adaptor subunit [Opitutales bacterium]
SRSRAELNSLKLRLSRLAEIGVKNSELENEARFKEAEIASLEIAAERSRALWQQATAGSVFSNGSLLVSARRDGIVQSLDLTEGAWGERGQSALTLIKSAPLEFKGTAFGNDDFSNAFAELAIRIGDKTERFAGTLRVASQIDETTQARTIYFVPEKLPEKIYPGQIARLDVFSPDAADGKFVLVPNSAVIKVGVDDVVFVCDATDPNKFTARKVKTLASRRGMTPVSDIHSGETVVSKGGYELKYVLPVDGNAPKRKAAGHFHADGKFHEGEH